MNTENQQQICEQNSTLGIVNCVAYRRSTGEKLASVALADVSETLAEDPDVFVWIGLHEPKMSVMDVIQEEFGLHELAIEDAMRNHQRAKIESYGNCLFMVLRTAQLVEEHIAFGATYVFLGERYLISIRQGASLSYVPVREHCEHNADKLKMGPVYVLYAILDYVVDNFLPITDQLGDYLREQEQAIFSENFSRQTLRHLYELKGQVVRFRMAIAPLHEVCSFFIYHQNTEKNGLLPKAAVPYFRDIQDHVLRTQDAIQGLNEMLQVAMDTYMAVVSVGQNEIVKRLASWAAILAIPTLIASIYGMNFSVMPELQWRYGYLMVMLLMLGSSAWLWLRFRRAKWL